MDKKKDTPLKAKRKDHANGNFMIKGVSSFSGNNKKSRKSHIRQAQSPSSEVEFFNIRPTKMVKYEAKKITFIDEDMNEVEYSYDDPLVVIAMVDNHNVHWILNLM